MRVEVEVKDSSKKTLGWSNMGDEKWQRDEMPRKCRGYVGEEKYRNCDGGLH